MTDVIAIVEPLVEAPTKKKERWSVSIGDYRARVRVYESDSGIIYYDISCLGIMGRSLRHRNKKRAVQWGKEQSAKIVTREDIAPGLTARWKRTSDLYLERQSPTKVGSQQSADKQRIALWTEVLGPEKDLSKLSE